MLLNVRNVKIDNSAIFLFRVMLGSSIGAPATSGFWATSDVDGLNADISVSPARNCAVLRSLMSP